MPDFYNPQNNNYQVGDIVQFSGVVFEGEDKELLKTFGFGLVIKDPCPRPRGRLPLRPHPLPHLRLPLHPRLRPRPRKDEKYYHTSILWNGGNVYDEWEGYLTKVPFLATL
tara:strand:- start:451 stop:783 length:333 start_codon:yes stop_codon:yes gene_type:complete